MTQRSARRLALAFTLAVTTWGTSAQAALFALDVTGVASGFDRENIFGLGADLTNVAFTQRFLIDDATLAAVPINQPGRTGIATYFSTPAVTSTVTINGRSLAFGRPSAQESGAVKEINGGSGTYFLGVFDVISQVSITGTSLSFTSSDPAFVAAADYRTPFSVTVDSGQGSLSYGFIDSPDYFGSIVSLDLIPQTASLMAATAVPEPAGWALLIGGFALVGAVARRTRTSRMTLHFG